MEFKLIVIGLFVAVSSVAEESFVLRNEVKGIEYGPYVFVDGNAIINTDFSLESVQSNSFQVHGFIRGVKHKWGPFCFSNNAPIAVADVPLKIVIIDDEAAVNLLKQPRTKGVVPSNKDAVFQTRDEVNCLQYLQMRRACVALSRDQMAWDAEALKTLEKLSKECFNPEVRRRALLINTLVWGLRDNPKEYMRCLGALANAFPIAELVDVASISNCVKVCSVCEGTGKGDKIKCRECDGTIKCNYCKGVGTVVRNMNVQHEPEKCPDCEGKGKCIYCRETGLVDGTCNRCNGSKREFAKEKIMFALREQADEAAMYCYLYYHPEKDDMEDRLFNEKCARNDVDAMKVLELINGQSGVAKYNQTIKSLLTTLKLVQDKRTQYALEQAALAEKAKVIETTSEEDDSMEFATNKAILFIKGKIEEGYILDAKYIDTEPSIFPFGGEDGNFFSKRYFVKFEFKYFTNAGFERWNEGDVQIGYLNKDKRWHTVHFNESSVTGVPFLETGEGRAMIENAANDAFRRLDRLGTTSGGRSSARNGSSDRFRSTDPRRQKMRRIGQR